MITYEWIPAVTHYKLQGTPGAKLDQLLALLVNAGHTAQVIEPTKTYRLIGDPVKLDGIAQQLAGDDEISLAVEAPGDDQVELTATVAPSRPYRRSVHVQGQGLGVTLVARAIDVGLNVEADGKLRWRVTGATAALLDWLTVHAHAATLDETLAAWGLTAAQAAAEDADGAAPVVKVLLPDRRKTTTAIERNTAGDIVAVTQEERDLPNED
jgi:hypothetical protein